MMKKVLLAFAFVLCLADVADAKVCLVDGPFGCMSWGPTTPPGWASTRGDNNAYAGEVVICSGTGMTGYCYYRGVPVGTTLVTTFGDMDTCESGFWCIRSFRTNLARSSYVYNGVALGPPSASVIGVSTVSNFTTFNISSAEWRN